MKLSDFDEKLIPTLNTSETESVQGFYKNKSILVTGATGFVGKVLVEKLLRSCFDIKKLYLLVRHKKDKKPSERINEIFSAKIFENVVRERPNFRNKVEVIEGDLSLPNLGLSSHDMNTLKENVNIIFNSAATIRFNEPLNEAISMNMGSVKRITQLAKDVNKLIALIHVSTAYVNCDNQHLDESICQPDYDPEKLIKLVENCDENLIKHISPKLIKNKPNTYVYTKNLAEKIIETECKEMPVGIFRPSIIGSAWKEPFEGWIDTYFGFTFPMITGGTGLFRGMMGNNDAICDLVPVDSCVNALISFAWYIGKKNFKSIKVFNFTSGQINTFKWGELSTFANIAFKQYPFENVQFTPNFQYTRSKVVYYYKTYILQLIPAYILDFIFRMQKRKQIFVNLQNKIKNFNDTIQYFTSNEWTFTNNTYFQILNELNPVDKITFDFDIRKIEWQDYIYNYSRGSKLFIMKEDPNRVDICKKKLKKIKIVENLIILGLMMLLLKYMLFDNEMGAYYAEEMYENFLLLGNSTFNYFAGQNLAGSNHFLTSS